jgi:hypothetical protein
MSSNLPPGVTQKMIDDYFSGPCDDCLDDRHEDCTDKECRCDECDEAAREDAEEMRAEFAAEARMCGDD